MARMVPDRLNNDVQHVERRMFALLAGALSDEYTVLHGARWLNRVPHSKRKTPDYEADFIIANESQGLLVLEVKGGLVSSDAATGKWWSRDMFGNRHSIKDPYSQARENCYSLLDLIRRSRGLPRDTGPVGYAVVFPDGRVDQPQPIAAPEELTVDAAELVGPERLRVRIQELFAFWRREREVVMTPAAVRQITEEVGRSLTMRSSLGPDIAEADRRIIELSEQQVALLDLMREGRRVQVLGCAGSGKTLLAAHKARLLAAQGYDVLLTCYNEPLATYLRRNLTGVEGLEVRSYHQLCSRWADLAGVPLHWPERRTAAFFERVLPEALEKAVERTGPSFDAVVVDEAQDFARMWWTPLLRLLRDGDDSILYVFADDNQRLYRRPPGMPEGLFPFTLNQNWRNTRRINAKVAEFYSGHPIVCMGPQGLPVEIREAATTEDVRRAVLDAVRRLVREDEVPVGDIVVLTPGAVQSSGLLGPLGDGLQLAEEPHGPDAIRLESVFRFKGMEATVVVLAGVPRTDQARPEVMYVGCSRARSHLVLVEMP